MNIEHESYAHAFGFPNVSKEELAWMIDEKATVVSAQWRALINRQTRLTFLTRLCLLFKPWKETLAPIGLPCAVTSMSGFPLYRYKEFRRAVYLLRPMNSPGFPGS